MLYYSIIGLCQISLNLHTRDHTIRQAEIVTGYIKYMIMYKHYYYLLQLVVKVCMEKTVVNNVAIIVTRPPNVTDLQESATVGVNQDGEETLVIRVRINNVKTHIVDNYIYSNILLYNSEPTLSYLSWNLV